MYHAILVVLAVPLTVGAAPKLKPEKPGKLDADALLKRVAEMYSEERPWMALLAGARQLGWTADELGEAGRRLYPLLMDRAGAQGWDYPAEKLSGPSDFVGQYRRRINSS